MRTSFDLMREGEGIGVLWDQGIVSRKAFIDGIITVEFYMERGEQFYHVIVKLRDRWENFVGTIEEWTDGGLPPEEILRDGFPKHEDAYARTIVRIAPQLERFIYRAIDDKSFYYMNPSGHVIVNREQRDQRAEKRKHFESSMEQRARAWWMKDRGRKP